MPTMNEQAASAARNMFPMNEQFMNIMKTNLDAQVSALTALTSKAIESLEQVVDLNLDVAIASIEDSGAITKQLLAAKDPQEFLSLTTAQAQPAVAKAIAYGRQLASIAAATQTEITRTAEEQVAETSRKFATMVEEVSKHAPAGSDNVMSIMKSAIDSTNAGYAQFNKSTRQAVDVLGANVNAAVNHFTQATEHAAHGTSRRNRKE